MKWYRFDKPALVGIGALAVIGIAALLFIRLIAPMVLPAAMVAFQSGRRHINGYL